MAFVEDRQLLELSISPKKSLFPVLNRAEAMSPWIVLLALIPPLYVMVNRTLTPLDALWGFKAVAMATSDSATVWLDPATATDDGKEVPLKWQPPLSSWLVAGVMRRTATYRPWALVLTSLLATSGLIVCVFGLADRLRGPEFAWWTACLLALHGPVLQGAETPAPVSLTLAFAVATCWGFVVHSQESKRLLSLPLGWGGVAWGFCLLAGGPVALVVLAILLLYLLALSREAKRPQKTNGKSRRAWKGKPAIQSLALMFGIGTVVGGWWTIWMAFRHGGPFLKGWVVGPSILTESTPTAVGFWGRILPDISQMGGTLIGLTALGVWVGVKLLRNPSPDSKRSGLALILSWMACASLVWVCLRLGQHYFNAFSVVWRGFCLVPTVLLAALAIEQIDLRRIGYLGVAFGVGLTAFFLLIWPTQTGFGLLPHDRPLWSSALPLLRGISIPNTPWVLLLLWRVIFFVSLGACVSWLLWRGLKNSDNRQRVFLGLSLGILLILHGLLNFLGVRQSTLNDQALAKMREEMVVIKNVNRWTIVTPDRSPLMLRYLLTSLWPNAKSVEIHSWYDPQLTEEISQGQDSAANHIVIDWNDRDLRTPMLRLSDSDERPHVVEFPPVGSPQILWSHRLRIYRLYDRQIPEDNESESIPNR